VLEGANWHSYVKAKRSISQVYYPLSCNAMFLSRKELEATESRDIVACAARLLNHHCEPTCKMVSEDMGPDFAIPGMPWTKGRVQAMYLHALRPLKEGTELTVDYNTIPYIMSVLESKQFVCEKKMANSKGEEEEIREVFEGEL